MIGRIVVFMAVIGIGVIGAVLYYSKDLIFGFYEQEEEG